MDDREFPDDSPQISREEKNHLRLVGTGAVLNVHKEVLRTLQEETVPNLTGVYVACSACQPITLLLSIVHSVLRMWERYLQRAMVTNLTWMNNGHIWEFMICWTGWIINVFPKLWFAGHLRKANKGDGICKSQTRKSSKQFPRPARSCYELLPPSEHPSSSLMFAWKEHLRCYRQKLRQQGFHKWVIMTIQKPHGRWRKFCLEWLYLSRPSPLAVQNANIVINNYGIWDNRHSVRKVPWQSICLRVITCYATRCKYYTP